MQQKKITNNKRLIANSKNSKLNQIIPTNGISYINLMATGEKLLGSNNIPQFIVAKITAMKCNIISINITEFGKDFVLSALVNGKWNEIVKLEKFFATFIIKYPIHLYSKRNTSVEAMSHEQSKLPHMDYLVHATTIDRPGILDKLLIFLSNENLVITEVNVKPYNNSLHLVTIEIQVRISEILPIVSLREKFLSYCDMLNLDGSLEPL